MKIGLCFLKKYILSLSTLILYVYKFARQTDEKSITEKKKKQKKIDKDREGKFISCASIEFWANKYVHKNSF